MKKLKLAALIFAAGFLLNGCSGASRGGFQPVENSIYVSSDGDISTATIETVQGEQYKEEELLAFAEQECSIVNEKWEAAPDPAMRKARKNFRLLYSLVPLRWKGSDDIRLCRYSDMQ